MSKGTIYLDNAATTWPKPEEVYRAVDTAMRKHGANPGRGSYRMSVDAQRMVDETRQEVCRLFNAPAPERVIFTLNCTDALNIVLKGLIKAGDRVVTGPYEHNSVTRPLNALRRCGAQVAVAKSTKTYRHRPRSFPRGLPRTCRLRRPLARLECHRLRVAGERNCRDYPRAGWIAHSRYCAERRRPRNRHARVGDRHSGGCGTQRALRTDGDRRPRLVRSFARKALP